MADIVRLSRSFKYGALSLEDPGRNMSPDEVKDFYANIYPELTQSSIEGPEYKDDQEIYEFRKTVGTKGLKSAPAKKAAAALTVQDAQALDPGEDGDLELMKTVYSAVFQSGHGGEAVLPPSEALGMI